MKSLMMLLHGSAAESTQRSSYIYGRADHRGLRMAARPALAGAGAGLVIHRDQHRAVTEARAFPPGIFAMGIACRVRNANQVPARHCLRFADDDAHVARG